MVMTNGIKAVSVIATGEGEAHYEHMYGTWKPDLWWIFFGRRWRRLPSNVYVVEHGKGLVLFDTGQDRAVVTDTNYYPGSPHSSCGTSFAGKSGPKTPSQMPTCRQASTVPTPDSSSCQYRDSTSSCRLRPLLAINTPLDLQECLRRDLEPTRRHGVSIQASSTCRAT
jgi:hypothetical protein